MAAGRLTPLGLACPRLVGRPIGMIGVVRPRPDIGPIGTILMIGMVRTIGVVRPSPDIGPVGLIGAIGALAYGGRRRAHGKGAPVRARERCQGVGGPRRDADPASSCAP